MGASTDDAFNALGVLGGVILAFSLLPQIYLAHKRRSTKDISYIWQSIYITGLLTLMAYFLYFELWPIFYPMAFELSCIFYLTSLKIYFEVIAPKAEAADIVHAELNNSDRVGRSATVQEELKPSLSLQSGSGVAVGSDAAKLGKGTGGGGVAQPGAEQA